MSGQATLRDTLEQWRDEMTREVRLVFDHDKAYDRIIALAEELAGGPENLQVTAEQQAAQARRMAELSATLDQIGTRVSDWEGPSRLAFDNTVGLLGERVAQLADLGDQSSRLLGAAHLGRQATDSLVHDLVRTSIDYAERSLAVARVMAFATSGMSLTSWTSSNLSQVARLLDQLSDAGRRVNALYDQVGFLIDQLNDSTLQLTDDLAGIEQRLQP